MYVFFKTILPIGILPIGILPIGILPVVYISIMLEVTVSYMILEMYLVMSKQSYYPLIV